MNIPCEQIRSDLSLDIAMDEVLPQKRMFEVVAEALGEENCDYIKFNKTHKVLRYKKDDGTYELFLVLAVSFMGGKHPVFRHRSQLKTWYKEIYDEYKDNNNYNIRILGVYHYQGNIIFVEFKKETYLKKKMHNSAAWVYTNDLYQAMKDGTFKRIDKNNNEIVAIKYTKLKEYIDGNIVDTGNELFHIFESFNDSFEFGHWLPASQAIPEMHRSGWSKWKETEWPGWFLEYRVDKYIREYGLENRILYVGSSRKRAGELDFDLWFDESNFYGDLKASDSAKKESPGNDQDNFIECINKYDKFWYVIYEHDTLKDSEDNDYEATRFRTNYIRDNNEWPKKKPWDELSYHTRMKNSVMFVKMYIIELNRINYREVLSDFNQGVQPSGDARKPKFKITKNNIDNFIVFSETAKDIAKRIGVRYPMFEEEIGLKVAEQSGEYNANN